MGCYADNASLSLPGTTLREISHRRQKECYLNDKTPPQAQLGSHVPFFPILIWNTPEEANYLRTKIAGPQNCLHNVAQRGFKNRLSF